MTLEELKTNLTIRDCVSVSGVCFHQICMLIILFGEAFDEIRVCHPDMSFGHWPAENPPHHPSAPTKTFLARVHRFPSDSRQSADKFLSFSQSIVHLDPFSFIMTDQQKTSLSNLKEKISNSSSEMMKKFSKSSKETEEADEEMEMPASPASPASRRQISTARRDGSLFSWFHKNKRLSLILLALLLLLIVIIASVLGTRDKGSGTPRVEAQVVDLAQKTSYPTTAPSHSPTLAPTPSPTAAPTFSPTMYPTSGPTGTTASPTTAAPTTSEPTLAPSTAAPSPAPIVKTLPPTITPTTPRPTLAEQIPCSDDDPCEQPQVCVLGICANARLNANSRCEVSSDCEENRCGLSEYSPTAKKTCCPNGLAHVFPVSWTLTHQWVCRQLAPGKLCSDDRSCASGACVQGVCAAERQADGAVCDTSFDCVNRMCGRTEFSATASYECCAGGDALLLDVPWDFVHENMCSHLRAGKLCMDDRSCESGVCVRGMCATSALEDGETCDKDSSCATGHCGRKEFVEDAPMICCENGDAIKVDPQQTSWRNVHEWICGQMELGSKCFDDSSCQSGVCSLGTCVDQTVSENMFCDSNQDCTNGRCGRSYLDAEAPFICCPEGRAVVQGVAWSGTFEWICSPNGQPQQVGNAPDGESCQDDLDCLNRVCGKDEFSASAGDICCPQGKSYNLPLDWTVETFCGNLPLGTVCGDDRMCESGKCVQGFCSSDLQADMASCGKHSDCSSRACAGGAFEENTAQVCCPGGERYRLEVPWTYGEKEFCGDLPVGSKCGSDRMCASGLCINGQCSTEQLGVGEECAEAADCENLSCAHIAYTANPDDARKECCPGGDSLLLHFPGGFLPDWYCDDVKRPIRAHCVRDDQCESGTCQQNSCL